MHYVDKSAVEPEVLNLLSALDTTEKSKWIAYNAAPRGKKPSPPKSGWNDAIVKEALVSVFQHNCGYCGHIIRGQRKEDGEMGYECDIDHYVPKTVDVNGVYDWQNYVLSCKGCNGRKLNYCDRDCMILSPCEFDDCRYLEYDRDTGQYFISSDAPDKEKLVARLELTIKRTFIHEEFTTLGRTSIDTEITERLDLLKYHAEMAQMELPNEYEAKLNAVKNHVRAHSFKLLIRDVILPKYKLHHPDFPLSATDLGIH